MHAYASMMQCTRAHKQKHHSGFMHLCYPPGVPTLHK